MNWPGDSRFRSGVVNNLREFNDAYGTPPPKPKPKPKPEPAHHPVSQHDFMMQCMQKALDTGEPVLVGNFFGTSMYLTTKKDD